MSGMRRSNGETVTTRDDVTVTRTLKQTEQGFVGTLRLHSTATDPVVVHLVDEFPTALPVDRVEFRDEAAPTSGTITKQGALILQRVGSDPVEIEYRIMLSAPLEVTRFSAPKIQDVSAAGVLRGPLPNANETSMTSFPQ